MNAQVIFKEWRSMSVELRKYSVAAGCLREKIVGFLYGNFNHCRCPSPWVLLTQKSRHLYQHRTVSPISSRISFESQKKVAHTRAANRHHIRDRGSQTGSECISMQRNEI